MNHSRWLNADDLRFFTFTFHLNQEAEPSDICTPPPRPTTLNYFNARLIENSGDQEDQKVRECNEKSMEKYSSCKSFPLLVHQIDETWMHDQFDMSIFHNDFQRTHLRFFLLIEKSRSTIKKNNWMEEVQLPRRRRREN